MNRITPRGYELRYYRIAFKKQVWKWLERYTSDFKKVHQRGCYYHPENGEDISDHVDIDVKNKNGSGPALIKCTTSGTPFTILLNGGNYTDDVTDDLDRLKRHAQNQIVNTVGWEKLNFNELIHWFDLFGRAEGMVSFRIKAKGVARESFERIINKTFSLEIQHINEELQDVVLKDLHQTIEPNEQKHFEVFQTNTRVDVDYGMITTEYLIRWHRNYQRIEFNPSGKKLAYW